MNFQLNMDGSIVNTSTGSKIKDKFKYIFEDVRYVNEIMPIYYRKSSCMTRSQLAYLFSNCTELDHGTTIHLLTFKEGVQYLVNRHDLIYEEIHLLGSILASPFISEAQLISLLNSEEIHSCDTEILIDYLAASPNCYESTPKLLSSIVEHINF